MYIEHDYHYINANENLLIEKGYGKISIHSIHFDRHYSEEQKEKNRQIAESMTSEQWSRHCEEVAKGFYQTIKWYSEAVYRQIWYSPGFRRNKYDGTL